MEHEAATWTVTGIVSGLAGAVLKAWHGRGAAGRAAKHASDRADRAHDRVIAFAQELEAMEDRLRRIEDENNRRHNETKQSLGNLHDEQRKTSNAVHEVLGFLRGRESSVRKGPVTP